MNEFAQHLWQHLQFFLGLTAFDSKYQSSWGRRFLFGAFLFLIFPISLWYFSNFPIFLNFRIPSVHQRGGDNLSRSNLSSQIQWVQARIANAATNAARTRSHRFNQATLNHGLETRNYQMLQSRFGNQPGGCQNCIFKSHLQVRNFANIYTTVYRGLMPKICDSRMAKCHK